MKPGEPRKGMKVVPHDKTVGDHLGLENSKHYKRMLEQKKKFLYVVGVSSKGNYYLHEYARKSGGKGDLFAPSDFSLYQPKIKIED